MSDRYNSYLAPMNSWSRLTEAIRELADNPDRVRILQENALATAESWPTWEDQADQIVATIESLVPFGRCSLVRQMAKNQYRSVLHPQMHSGNPQPGLAEADRGGRPRARVRDAERAARAEAELAELKGSRAMRLVRALQRGRSVLAPDQSWRWLCLLGAGRFAWRAARRLRAIGRAG
jgi:hypothetical protein